MKDSRALMLANAGLIAGLALGSIAIAGSSTRTPWAAAGTDVRGVAEGAVSPGSPAAAETPRRRQRGVRRLPALVAALARMDVRDVEWQRHAGQSLAAIAAGKGLTSERVVAAELAELSEVLDGDVDSGRISAAQKDRVLRDADARLGVEMAAVMGADPPGGPVTYRFS